MLVAFDDDFWARWSRNKRDPLYESTLALFRQLSDREKDIILAYMRALVRQREGGL